MASSSPTPYNINVPQEKIDTLRTKLALATFPDELENAGWDMGAPLADIKRLAKKWETFDWRSVEGQLNEEMPQFETKIPVDGFGDIDVHFVWRKSGVPGAIPLLFVHGWPGSFIEVRKILPELVKSDGKAPAFDVVAPSLPNFGFSQGIPTRGFAIAQYAETMHKLMLSLSYPQYVTQGGDWGWFITRAIAGLYPQSCRATHFNVIMTSPPTLTTAPLLALSPFAYSAKERAGFARSAWFRTEGMGYYMEQSTKPQTLGYGLNDSPIALLAWIYEKLHDWTDAYPWSDDEVLTWISIYQFSRAGPGAAGRIYYEYQHTPTPDSPSSWTHKGKVVVTKEQVMSYMGNGVPIGIAHFPKELAVYPKSWGRMLGKVVYQSEQERGGHFAAHECPEVIVRDLRAMFGRGGGAFGVVKGRDGYGGGNVKVGARL